MARPKNKSELLSLGDLNYKKLFELIEGLSIIEQNKDFPKGTMNRNIRDVLTHLHHWHLMLLDWHKSSLTNVKPEMPAKGFTWKTLPDLNKKIWRKYQSTSLSRSKKLINNSHKKVLEIINGHTNSELFEKKLYKWTGSTSIGSYFVSATSSHYDWAYKLIKKAVKTTLQ